MTCPLPHERPRAWTAQINTRIPEARDLLMESLCVSGITALIDIVCAHNARPLLFAGAVRDALRTSEHGVAARPPRDFDVGLLGLARETFDGVLKEFGAHPNRHGGYRLSSSVAPPVDVWRLEETVGLHVHKAPCMITNILRSFVLDINAVAFDPLSGMFHDCGAGDAIRARRVGLVRNALVHSTATFAAKALLAAIRLSFDITEPLQHFISRYEHSATTAYEATKIFGQGVSLEPISSGAAASLGIAE